MVEHYLDTVGVTGSNPVSRTISQICTSMTAIVTPIAVLGLNYSVEAETLRVKIA